MENDDFSFFFVLLLLLLPFKKGSNVLCPGALPLASAGVGGYLFFCLLQLLFGGSKLQASGLQKGPLATTKQHLIACRNRAQTYPQKLPNAPAEFLEKISLFLSPAAVVSFSVSCSSCLVAPSCKHQACRRDPSPQQNST